MLINEIELNERVSVDIPEVVKEFIPSKFQNNPHFIQAISYSLNRAAMLARSMPAREPPTGPNGYLPVYYLCKATGYAGTPRIAKKAVIDKLIASGKYLEVWRGIGSGKWVDNFKYTNNNFIGGRNMVIGIWTAPGPEGYKKAKDYAGGNPENLLRMVIPNNIKFISMKDASAGSTNLMIRVHEKMSEIIGDDNYNEESKLQYLQLQMLCDDFFSNPTIYAIMNGYEATYVFEDELVIFDRTKLIIQQETPEIPQ